MKWLEMLNEKWTLSWFLQWWLNNLEFIELIYHVDFHLLNWFVILKIVWRSFFDIYGAFAWHSFAEKNWPNVCMKIKPINTKQVNLIEFIDIIYTDYDQ